MNGRIFDPTLGRFLQADPFIQAPKNSQSYNRYSYVLNNPLSFTDPGGYLFKSLFKKLNKAFGKFAPFVGLGLMLIPGVGTWAATTWYNAATIGFVSGGIATGSLKGALIGAFSGAAFQQIGAGFKAKYGSFAEASFGGQAAWVGSHALTGGITSTLNGGKFGHGFWSAGLTKAFNVNSLLPGVSDGMNSLRVLAAAIIGGTISEVTGGKFANGAATAALGQAVNGNSFWNKAKELGEFAVQFLPGADLVGCMTNECSMMEWSLAVGEVAMTVAGGGAITVAYKAFKAYRTTSKSLGANPFKGKTAEQIDKMFRDKGFETRGPDPKGGTGGYVNPKTGRSYHIDPEDWGKYREPDHVDVNRARGYSGGLEKLKYPFGG